MMNLKLRVLGVFFFNGVWEAIYMVLSPPSNHLLLLNNVYNVYSSGIFFTFSFLVTVLMIVFFFFFLVGVDMMCFE